MVLRSREHPLPSTHLRDYNCGSCGWFLFASDATAGRAKDVRCTNKGCKRRQTIHFGPPSAKPVLGMRAVPVVD